MPIPRPVALLLASALLTPAALADSAQSQSNGFVEDGRWNLLNRSVFDQRDYKHGGRNSAARNAYKPRHERSGKAEEWAYGLMGTFRSGFTQGLIGVGVDAHAYLGVQLDSGGGRVGKARLLGVDNEGHPKNEYSRAGAALKLRMSDTVLSYGEQRVKTPVFSSSDSRLLPETATGLFLDSSEFDNLKLVAGHFNESTDRNAASHDQGFVVNYSNGRQGNSFDLAGVAWNPGAAFSGSLYTSRYQDSWNQHYLGSTLSHALDERRSLSLDLNLYPHHRHRQGAVRAHRQHHLEPGLALRPRAARLQPGLAAGGRQHAIRLRDAGGDLHCQRGADVGLQRAERKVVAGAL